MKTMHHWFYDELLLFNFRLVWPVTKASLTKYIMDEFSEVYESENDTFGGKALQVITEKSQSNFIVALRRWSGNSDDHAVLAHECLHVANMILQTRGVKCDQDNDEMSAYLTAYLVRKCLNVLLPKRLTVRVDPSVKPKRR